MVHKQGPLACSALDLPLTAAEAGAGLVPPAAATYLLGSGGSILIILVRPLSDSSALSSSQVCSETSSGSMCPLRTTA